MGSGYYGGPHENDVLIQRCAKGLDDTTHTSGVLCWFNIKC